MRKVVDGQPRTRMHVSHRHAVLLLQVVGDAPDVMSHLAGNALAALDLRVGAKAVEHNGGALLGKRVCDAQADARRRSRHDGKLSVNEWRIVLRVQALVLFQNAQPLQWLESTLRLRFASRSHAPGRRTAWLPSCSAGAASCERWRTGAARNRLQKLPKVPHTFCVAQ